MKSRVIDMFSPNTDSFVLTRTRRPTVKRSFPVFSPNTDSFLLIQKPAVRPRSASGTENAVATVPQPTDSGQSKIKDQSKRNFLKVAGVVGASAITSQIILPKKAQALILGSSPTTGVVGVKDSANARINPATEETLASVLESLDGLSLTGGNSYSDSLNLPKSGLVDADRHVQVDVLSSELPSSASTETTLQTISFGGFKLTLRLATVGDVDYVGEAAIGTATSAAAWRIKKVDNTSGLVITWAGTGVFNQVWDNRDSLTYS